MAEKEEIEWIEFDPTDPRIKKIERSEPNFGCLIAFLIIGLFIAALC